MIKALLIVGTGSFVGGAVNLVGCLVFGMVFALFGKHGTTTHPWCLLLTTGLCGGFTTFSTFAHESVQMLQGGQFGAFAAYVIASIVIGLAMIAVGYMIVR